MATTSRQAAPDLADLEALLLELRELAVEIRGHLARDRARRPAPLDREDRTLLRRLLPAIAGALGSDPFTSRDLAATSAPALRLVLRGLSVKQIGRLLSRADGAPVDGWMVARCGVEINVALWRVVAVINRLESGTALGPSGAMDGGAFDA